MKRLANYFFKGLVFLVPIALTIYVFVAIFRTIDGWLGHPVPGVGFASMVILTTLFGFLLSNFLTRQILRGFETLMDRLPFARLLHSAVKDLMNAFVGEQRRFDRPVVVELAPGTGIRALGFITRDSLDVLGLGDDVAVYLPQAYNVAGQLLVVPRAQVRPLEVDSAQVLAIIVSGGVSGR